MKETLMIEPTETESKETLDAFISCMIQIRKEIEENPSFLKQAPHNLPIGRLDEVKAAKELKLRWEENRGQQSQQAFFLLTMFSSLFRFYYRLTTIIADREELPWCFLTSLLFMIV